MIVWCSECETESTELASSHISSFKAFFCAVCVPPERRTYKIAELKAVDDG